MADDPWLCFLVRCAGFRVKDTRKRFHTHWRCDVDYKQLSAAGYLAFHPTKLSPKPADPLVEVHVRNHFRRLRKEPEVLCPDAVRGVDDAAVGQQVFA